MKTDCSFRVYTVLERLTNHHFRCLAADEEFVVENEGVDICNGCSIPEIMAEEHCLYLEPRKRFLRGIESIVVLHCTKFDTILPDLHQCRQCSGYTCFNAR